MICAKLKSILRKMAERSIPALWDRIQSVLDEFKQAECAACLSHAELNAILIIRASDPKWKPAVRLVL